MLKKIASDALGLSDIGKFVDPEDYDKTQSDDFVRDHDGEEIHCLIATKADEYCFTNMALVHIDGHSATSSRRTMRRYPYFKNKITNVLLETAGNIDLDVELKFQIGDQPIEISVARKQMERLKPLYNVLLTMSEEMEENELIYHNAQVSLQHATEALQHMRMNMELTPRGLSDAYRMVTVSAHNWLEGNRKEYMKKDYKNTFEKYL